MDTNVGTIAIKIIPAEGEGECYCINMMRRDRKVFEMKEILKMNILAKYQLVSLKGHS